MPAQLFVPAVGRHRLDLPASHTSLQDGDTFTMRMFEAINGMMLDMLAAIARKDNDDRRRRQAQGIAKAEAEGRYRGRPEDVALNKAIVDMLSKRQSWNSIVAATGCSRSTLSRLAKRVPNRATERPTASRSTNQPMTMPGPIWT